MKVRDYGLITLRERLTKLERSGNLRLPAERQLAEELNISRRMLRQALDILEAEGLIWRHVGRGTFIGSRPPINAVQTNLLAGRTHSGEIMSVRMLLEPQIAAMAALYTTPSDVVRMRECAKKSAAAPDVNTFELWDSRLHLAIAEATHNSLLVSLFSAVLEIRKTTEWGKLKAESFNLERHRTYSSDHQKLIDSIAQRDAPAAEEAMREHLDAIEEHLFRRHNYLKTTRSHEHVVRAPD
jgi:DNA-binding FadR family transcriptional regulator